MTSTTTKIINVCLVAIGILSAGLGLKGFLVPNGFIDGGVTGTSMFVSELSDDGTEIVANLTSRKIGISVGNFILIFNVTLFSTAAFLLGAEAALYSILTYFAASRMVDFIIHGIEEHNGIMIISKESEKIRRAIIDTIGRGVTVFAGRGGRDSDERDILICVVARFEIPKIKRTIQAI